MADYLAVRAKLKEEVRKRMREESDKMMEENEKMKEEVRKRIKPVGTADFQEFGSFFGPSRPCLAPRFTLMQPSPPPPAAAAATSSGKPPLPPSNPKKRFSSSSVGRKNLKLGVPTLASSSSSSKVEDKKKNNKEVAPTRPLLIRLKVSPEFSKQLRLAAMNKNSTFTRL